MKVFLSWSGARSHKIALVFRDWLPSVIQEIVPYVSSEDIDKGARWSTDIAKELSDSKFGILCVTRENIDAPWLTFEAGALSRTIDKAFVSPFLFDIRRSEVDGPILQFQSTVFEREDLRKLVTTLNKACDNDGLSADRLNKAFEVWYPTLEEELARFRDSDSKEQEADSTAELQVFRTQEILEEILELSRINQKLIRNPDGTLESNLEEIGSLLRTLLERTERLGDPTSKRWMRRLQPMMLEELLYIAPLGSNGYLGVQMVLGIVRNQYPWIYDAGIETINILRSRRRVEEKHQAIEQFSSVLKFSNEHPMMREFFLGDPDMEYFYRKLQEMLIRAFERETR